MDTQKNCVKASSSKLIKTVAYKWQTIFQTCRHVQLFPWQFREGRSVTFRHGSVPLDPKHPHESAEGPGQWLNTSNGLGIIPTLFNPLFPLDACEHQS